MTLAGFKAQNHPQQVGKRGRNPEVDDRATAPEHFADFQRRFGPFTLDVAASAENTKCERFYTIEDDGLAQSWAGERVWCNPPYSSIEPWIDKAWHEHPTTLGIVMLPANRTEQGWWQRHIEPYRHGGHGLRVEFLPGRMRFIRAGASEVGPNERPPFGCCLLIWGAA
jgi:phage N-6-adenine-methyltransferase